MSSASEGRSDQPPGEGGSGETGDADTSGNDSSSSRASYLHTLPRETPSQKEKRGREIGGDDR